MASTEESLVRRSGVLDVPPTAIARSFSSIRTASYHSNTTDDDDDDMVEHEDDDEYENNTNLSTVAPNDDSLLSGGDDSANVLSTGARVPQEVQQSSKPRGRPRKSDKMDSQVVVSPQASSNDDTTTSYVKEELNMNNDTKMSSSDCCHVVPTNVGNENTITTCTDPRINNTASSQYNPNTSTPNSQGGGLVLMQPNGPSRFAPPPPPGSSTYLTGGGPVRGPPAPVGFPRQPTPSDYYGHLAHHHHHASRLISAAGLMGGPESALDAHHQEVLPLYQNASAAPSRLPAHKPVRLTQPKHPLAPPGTPVYFKYGEEHYPEETIPDVYTFTENDGTVCRYITNFLVYNKRGERLLPIEVLDQPRHGALVLYGSLLPAASMGPCQLQDGNNGRSKTHSVGKSSRSEKSSSGSRRSFVRRGHRSDDESPMYTPYPVRVELSDSCIDYGQEPQNVPFIWLISRWDVYYRLEKPAGRYIPTFATAKMKFEVSTRIIKTLQYKPDTDYKTLVDLLTAATRQAKCKRRQDEARQRRREQKLARRTQKQQQYLKDIHHHDAMNNPPSCEGFGDSSILGDSRTNSTMPSQVGSLGDGDAKDTDETKSISDIGCSADGYDEIGSRNNKRNRSNWRVHHSLSTPEGTGIALDEEQPTRTPWGAPYAVDNVRESTLLGLGEFLEGQMRNFLEGVGGVGGECANLLETVFMQTLREKAALRRETLSLVESKKRAIEAMAATGFPAYGTTIDPTQLATPIVAAQVHAVPIRGGLPSTVQCPLGAPLGSPVITAGFDVQHLAMQKGYSDPTGYDGHHLMMMRTRHVEEQELNQLLQLLREFSDPDSDIGFDPRDLSEEDDADSECDTDDELSQIAKKSHETLLNQSSSSSSENHSLHHHQGGGGNYNNVIMNTTPTEVKVKHERPRGRPPKVKREISNECASDECREIKRKKRRSRPFGQDDNTF